MTDRIRKAIQDLKTPPFGKEMQHRFLCERIHSLLDVWILLLAFIVCSQLFNMAMMAWAREGGLAVFSHKVYFGLYIVLCTAAFSGLVLLFVWKRNVRANAKRIQTALFIFGLIASLWSVAVTLYDQRVTENVTVYTYMVLTISILAFLKPWQAFTIFGSSQLLLVILLPTFQPVPTNNMGNIMNTTFCALMSVVIACSRYLTAVREYWSRDIIKRQTEEIQRINAGLNVQVITDELTGLYNRRFLDERLPSLWESYVGSNVRAAVMMLDIDDFKRFNDRYGHQAGDRCIQQISDLIKKYFSESTSTVIRYGGEEFLVLDAADGVDEHIRTNADGLRRAVEQMHIENTAVGRYVTISAGICIGNVISGDIIDFIAAADEALYTAKKSGKNRIEISEQGTR